MVAVAIPEFDAESAFDGTLADRWERELRGREVSAGMLCLFLWSVIRIKITKLKKKIKKKSRKINNPRRPENPTQKWGWREGVFSFKKIFFFKKKLTVFPCGEPVSQSAGKVSDNLRHGIGRGVRCYDWLHDVCSRATIIISI